MEGFKAFLPFAKTISNVGCKEIQANTTVSDTRENPGNSSANIQVEKANFSYNHPSENEICQDSQEFATPSPTPNRKRRTASSNCLVDAPSAVDRVIEHLQNKRGRNDYDATELIFLGYAKTIKSFSLERQAQTKLEIAQVIMKQEIEHIREQARITAATKTPIQNPIPLEQDSNSQSNSVILELEHSPMVEDQPSTENSLASFFSRYDSDF